MEHCLMYDSEEAWDQEKQMYVPKDMNARRAFFNRKMSCCHGSIINCEFCGFNSAEHERRITGKDGRPDLIVNDIGLKAIRIRRK